MRKWRRSSSFEGIRWGSAAALLGLCALSMTGCDFDSAARADGEGGSAGTGRRSGSTGPRSVSLFDAGGRKDSAVGTPSDGGEMVSLSGDGALPMEQPNDGGAPLPDGATPPPQAGSGGPAPVDYTIPTDPGARGPWPVGVRTVSLPLAGGNVPVEIWYPAQPGSEAGKPTVVYDFIEWLPRQAQDELPESAGPVPVECNCYRDLPLDGTHGPYPISVLVHNTGAFRVASVSLMSHWASRGFVAVAIDHPRLALADSLASLSLGRCTGSGLSEDTRHTRDVPALLDALRSPSGEFAFLSGQLDPTRIAVSGHGDGADWAVAASGQPGVRLIMPWMDASAVTRRGDLAGVVYIGGLSDDWAPYSSIETTFVAAGSPALLVGVRNAGHLSITELCNSKNAAGEDGVDISLRYTLCDLDFTLLNAIWDCKDSYLSQEQADLVFGFATTAALEEFLKGEDETESWNQFKTEWGEVRQLR